MRRSLNRFIRVHSFDFISLDRLINLHQRLVLVKSIPPFPKIHLATLIILSSWSNPNMTFSSGGPKKIHATKLNGFLLKIALFLFAFQIEKALTL